MGLPHCRHVDVPDRHRAWLGHLVRYLALNRKLKHNLIIAGVFGNIALIGVGVLIGDSTPGYALMTVGILWGIVCVAWLTVLT